MNEVQITDVEIPDRLGTPDAADFEAAIAVRTAVNAHDSGSNDESRPPEEMLPTWRKQEHEPKRMLLARERHVAVARAVIEYRLGDAVDTAWLHVEVMPEHRGRGIGRTMAQRLLDIASGDGKIKAIVYAPSWRVGGDRMDAPTGFGDVPADTAETRLLLSLGFRLEQVERGSRLPLPLDRALLERVRDEAAQAAGPDYRTHRWGDHTPERWQNDLAHLLTRMSTDAPSAGLDESEDPWTVERLLEDEQLEAEGPRTGFTAAVEHVPSGRLVAFTTLYAPAELDRPVDQEDTIVLREHRGHRLGMLVKAENLLYLDELRPGHPAVVTYNAEENRHMLGVNEALGFVPFVYEGAWRKDLKLRAARAGTAGRSASHGS